MRLRAGYAAAAIAVFLIEAGIAAFVHDSFVRPHLGDSLAVVLVYLALRAVTPIRVGPAALLALAIACAIEVGQYVHLARLLGLAGNPLARALIGDHFDPEDFVAYAAGALATMLVEGLRARRR